MVFNTLREHCVAVSHLTEQTCHSNNGAPSNASISHNERLKSRSISAKRSKSKYNSAFPLSAVLPFLHLLQYRTSNVQIACTIQCSNRALCCGNYTRQFYTTASCWRHQTLEVSTSNNRSPGIPEEFHQALCCCLVNCLNFQHRTFEVQVWIRSSSEHWVAASRWAVWKRRLHSSPWCRFFTPKPWSFTSNVSTCSIFRHFTYLHVAVNQQAKRIRHCNCAIS